MLETTQHAGAAVEPKFWMKTAAVITFEEASRVGDTVSAALPPDQS
jgi:hypothetical protein